MYLQPESFAAVLLDWSGPKMRALEMVAVDSGVGAAGQACTGVAGIVPDIAADTDLRAAIAVPAAGIVAGLDELDSSVELLASPHFFFPSPS